MARWLVHLRDRQVGVDGLVELRALAREGQLTPGDLVQPPGAVDWLYALEIDELKADLASGAAHVTDRDDDGAGRSNLGLAGVAALLLAGIAAGGGYMAYQYAGQLPDPERQLLDQVSFTQMVVTDQGGARLVGEPDANAAVVATLQSGAVLDLLAKRKTFYKARDPATGAEGWIGVDQVVPAYLLGGGEVLKEHDPLYNPDRYLFVTGASWMQMPEQAEEGLTIFQVRLQNNSMYDMSGLVLAARIKDSHGQELEQVEFVVEGTIPAGAGSMIGTLLDPTSEIKRVVTEAEVEAAAKVNPEAQLDYTEGVEVKMATVDFTAASIDIVELRAVPPEKPAG